VKDEKNTDDSWINHILMKEAMDSLSEREKRILALRFYDGKTQMEVASEIGISQAQVSRLEKGVIDKIKKNL
ncbi:MAG: sigma-70 family RNA polymerase sigma factor, partial [Clostridia bacterium]|nr:sigma-70 family RNA polymerase sigma factor [Clostridia bacterium]